MAERRLNRMIRQVRRWRSHDRRGDELHLAPTLPEADLRRLRRLIDECIEGRGGEVAARRRATAVGASFLDLDATGRKRFFDLLADDYDHDDEAVDRAIADVVAASDLDQRRQAEDRLKTTLEPRRGRLLRRFVGIDGGLPFLIDLREELLPLRRESSGLAALDDDLRTILTSWFDVALLRLERLDWNSPAAVLEKLIEYEAVHAIESWDDLRGRLGSGRRCYAFFHPSMPGEPLIFVEVALTQGISRDLPPLLDHSLDRIEPTAADTAIFYSISNCHQGLAGVPLGDLLIKQVVQQLTAELPNLTTFSTLSPMPGFRSWLEKRLTDPNLLTEPERAQLSPTAPDQAVERLVSLINQPKPQSSTFIEPARSALLRLAARYLTVERREKKALDPVANFHLSNGSRVERINWWANPSFAGWQQSLGLMVNYRYRPEWIEANHDAYEGEGVIMTSAEVAKLLGQ
jgi:malonyl-CoA decarboxylase